MDRSSLDIQSKRKATMGRIMNKRLEELGGV